ncbi:hypothetical protein [Streptomyces sp. TLI_185]|uniref:hypothetical protein n=1 Tax=Streptomyces sp. TLI_185 TaxID=2485151 RepID=UPI000F4D9105|nr:hypothetical protein [Streptomyces sp. TLI_185]RPF39390.1 hypothetical protein EDD92_9647 [Streptomyces sp. TLI_185]
MDPHGPIARRFPLVARFRPACLPLPDRVRSVTELAARAVKQSDQGLASTVFNQSALIASDLGRPDLARAMCHRHAEAYLNAGPLPAMSAIRALEPLVNLARLQIRAGRTDEGRQRLLDLYEAVGAAAAVSLEGITVPADLTCTEGDRQEVRAWLWRVLLADGTRSLTTTGRWSEALAHIEQHRGVGTRMLDGRQVAVIAALTSGQTSHAHELLAATAPGEAWEQVVTACLMTLCRRDVGQPVDDSLTLLTNTYLNHEANAGMTIFDVRLGLTVLDVVGSAEHPLAPLLVDDLCRRTMKARNGYAAREVLAHPLFDALAKDAQWQDCENLLRSCALDSGVLPEGLHRDLATALETGEMVLSSSLSEAKELGNSTA